jgi:2-desacetyl-2-hydroxyethyl bacteriochlorophyllide A dehydrogenase
MKAAVITEVGNTQIDQVPDPIPNPGDVVIAVHSVGICGTDLHILEGLYASALPVIPGHEVAGEVVAVGGAVDGVQVGDRVAVDPALPCNRCHECRQGRGNLCENYTAIGVTVDGGSAEFMRAPAANCWKVPDGVDLSAAALVEPLACAVRGYDVIRHDLGVEYLIYGAGTMGLMMTSLALRAGAAGVSVVDINADKLATPAQLGCATAASADGFDRPRGWDVVIDCTGVAAAISDGLTRVARGGTFLQFGVAPREARVSVEPFRIYNQEITITGSMALLNSFTRAGGLLAAGAIDPALFLTHRAPLDEYAHALELFAAGAGRKIQVAPNSDGVR